MTTLMTTSRTALGGLLALALLPALWPADAAAHSCDAPFTTDLVTGRGIDVGEVKVCNDADLLTVTYETTFPWCVLKTHLHVASDLAGIPKFRLLRTPNWLRFDFIEDVDCEGEVTFEIPLDEIDGGVLPGDSVVVAARAVVEGDGADGTHPRCLLGDKCVAWGEGPLFRPRLPAMYFTYTVQEPFLCGGETSKCVFVTSTRHTGDLGGLAGADAICQDLAEAGGSLAAPGTYKAWLSDATASPSTRFTQASVPYKLVDGTTIADDWADLTDGNLNAPIGRTEQGGDTPSFFVWTATTAQGLAGGLNCQAWTSNATTTSGAIGLANVSTERWSFASLGSACQLTPSLFCFQQ
ncbi:MAG: DUF1554 domain-containing protein [Geminicoccaceae bacterium]